LTEDVSVGSILTDILELVALPSFTDYLECPPKRRIKRSAAGVLIEEGHKVRLPRQGAPWPPALP
jgi:hypothetical protein